jgi:hypothetical protein
MALEPDTSHFHIQWSSRDSLDWKRFATRTEANEFAQQLVRSGESFTIEQIFENCPICRTRRKPSGYKEGSISQSTPD